MPERNNLKKESKKLEKFMKPILMSFLKGLIFFLYYPYLIIMKVKNG